MLQLQPASEIEQLDRRDHWLATRGPIRFELDPGTKGFPQGWVLMRAKLSRTILDGSAELLAQTASGDAVIKVPVAVGGSMFEVVKLPAGIRRLVWQPSCRSGTFLQTPITARALGMLERRWLMLRRVLARCWIEPAGNKARVGLSWWRPWFDLEGQYRACGELRGHKHDIPYPDWIERCDRLTDHDRGRIRRRIAKLRNAPHFDIVIHGSGAGAEETKRSLEAQIYRNYSIVEPAAPLDPAHYISVLQAGDRLAEHALYWAAETITAGGDVAMAYADEDVIDAAGTRSDPRFKPDWSPEHLRSINYVGRWALVRGAELAAAGGLSQDSHQLNLRVAAALGTAKVLHLPAVLYHRSSANPPPLPAPRARHPLPAKAPLVSIIIPTRDREALLRNCIQSIERASTWRNYEILVVDNRSSDEGALRYLAGLKHRVLRYDREFNYSAINNLGVREARGEVVLLLNNDTEVISPDWLEEMLGHLHQPGVGVAGAKLLYADGTVQHAGDAVGPGGCADHMHTGIARDAPGYCHRAVVAHEVSAVTGACLMTWKDLYQRLGGLDEAKLPVSFNDVDYCLRVQQAGQRVIFTPHAELYHHESATRGRDTSAAEAAREAREMKVIRRQWRERLEHDPYYNPNLSYWFPDFSLGDEPRVRKPWVR